MKELKSRARSKNCRNFQVNILEEVREIAKFASVHHGVPLYAVVEYAITETFGKEYEEFKKGDK